MKSVSRLSRPVISSPAILVDGLVPKQRHPIDRARGLFEVRPFTDPTRQKNLNDVILRNIFNKCGADFMQGKRVGLGALKKVCPFATEGQLLAAIDTSAVLRWVDRIKGAEFWIDGDEPGSGDVASDAADDDNGHMLVPLRLAPTAVFRNHIRPISFLGRPAVEPAAFFTSTPAIMRRRRGLLRKKSDTQDLMLLGSPCQVYMRLCFRDPTSIVVSYMNGSLHAEGVNDALGFPLPVVDAIDKKIGDTKRELQAVAERVAKENLENQRKKNNSNSHDKKQQEEGDCGGGEEQELKKAIRLEELRQKQLFYVRKTLAANLIEDLASSSAAAAGDRNQLDLDVYDPLAVDSGPVAGSFGSDTIGSSGRMMGQQQQQHQGPSAENLLQDSERHMISDLRARGEFSGKARFDRSSLRSQMMMRQTAALSDRLHSAASAGPDNKTYYSNSKLNKQAIEQRGTGLLGRSFDATRSVLSISDMLKSRRRVPFEMALAEFQSRAPGFCMLHYFSSKLRTADISRRKPAVMMMFDPTVGSRSRHVFFHHVILYALAQFRMPFPVNTHALQLFSATPLAACDITSVIRHHIESELAPPLQQEKQQQQQWKRFPAASLSVAFCGKEVIENEILPVVNLAAQVDQRDEAVRIIAEMLARRWKAGGVVAVLALSVNSALGFSDFRLVPATCRSEQECIELEILAREKHSSSSSSSSSSSRGGTAADLDETTEVTLLRQGDELDSDAATGPLIDHKRSRRQLGRDLCRGPLCTMVGDGRVAENIYDSIKRATVTGFPSSSAAWLDQNRKLPRVAPSGQQETKKKQRQASSCTIDVPARQAMFVSSLEQVCLVSGWTSEFGAECAPELLRRYLVGMARDAPGVAAFVRTRFSLRDGFATARRKYMALFAFPSDDGGVPCWSVVAPRDIFPMSRFRHQIQEEIAVDLLDSDDEDDDDEVETSSSQWRDEEPYIVIQLDENLFIMLCRESL